MLKVILRHGEILGVTFTDSDNKTMNILFCNLNRANPKIGSRFAEDDRLAPETHDMLLSYALDIINENTAIKNKRSKISKARYFLCLLEENVATASLEKIQSVIDSMTYNRILTSFICWLHQHKMLPQSCQPYINTTAESASTKCGDDALQAEQDKLPSEKALLALGAIFYDVIPPYQDGDKNNIGARKFLTAPTQEHRDSFTCTMAALGMASPNRVAAEQVILDGATHTAPHANC